MEWKSKRERNEIKEGKSKDWKSKRARRRKEKERRGKNVIE